MASGIDPAAAALADAAVAEVLASQDADPPALMVVRAPAGAGKTGLVERLVRARTAAGESVAVATTTKEQAAEIVERLAAHATPPIVYTQSATSPIPSRVLACSPGRVQITCQGADLIPQSGAVLIGSGAKLAHVPTDVGQWDLLIVDEAWQLRTAEFIAAHSLGSRWILIGDPGQIPPFTTVDPTPWTGPGGVLAPAAQALLHRFPTTPVIDLPITRRLPHDTAVTIGPLLYPDLVFRALVTADARRLLPRPDAPPAIAALKKSSLVRLELPGTHQQTSTTTPVATIRSLVDALIGTRYADENGTHVIGPADIAVAAAWTEQVGALRWALADTGVQPETANRLQGRTFQITLMYDPLAGDAPLSEFSLDPGRLCVGLTRHRIGAILVSDADVPHRLVEHLPTSSLLPAEFDDREQRGLDIHRQLIEQLPNAQHAIGPHQHNLRSEGIERR